MAHVHVQFDGGRTYTEPSCIITGSPEGLENVSDLLLQSPTSRCNAGNPLRCYKVYLRTGAEQLSSETGCMLQVPVRVHDACFTSGVPCCWSVCGTIALTGTSSACVLCQQFQWT